MLGPSSGRERAFHFPHRPAAMDFHRRLVLPHIAGDLLAEPTSRDLNYNLALAWDLATAKRAWREAKGLLFFLPAGHDRERGRPEWPQGVSWSREPPAL